MSSHDLLTSSQRVVAWRGISPRPVLLFLIKNKNFNVKPFGGLPIDAKDVNLSKVLHQSDQ